MPVGDVAKESMRSTRSSPGDPAKGIVAEAQRLLFTGGD
jgi:hypothetical protein